MTTHTLHQRLSVFLSLSDSFVTHTRHPRTRTNVTLVNTHTREHAQSSRHGFDEINGESEAKT